MKENDSNIKKAINYLIIMNVYQSLLRQSMDWLEMHTRIKQFLEYIN